MNDHASQEGNRLQHHVGISQTGVTLVIVLLFGISPLLPRIAVIAISVAMALLTVFSRIMRWNAVPPLGVFCSVCTALSMLGWPSQLWLAIGLAAYFTVSRLIHYPRARLNWFAAGSITRHVAAWMVMSMLLSAIALILWYVTIRPDITDIIEQFVPDWNLALLIFGGLIFSMVNAAVEEGAFRGVIMDALDKSIGPVPSLLTQATAFGVFHIHGFPRGAIGIGLSMVFGTLMGLIRRRSGGMLAPWIAHAGTDIVIVIIVLTFRGAW